ncbi:swr complex subunit [Linderina pennispora]|nr:swr complex subunit [Linderina pennispora]
MAGPKQKPKGLSRELTSLYLENQPVPVALDQFRAKPKFGTKAERWVWRGFKSSARNDDLVLHHWTKANEQFTDYFYARYNAKTKPCQYTDDEYTKRIEPLDAAWTRTETDYLLKLCEQFDLRFVVIHDRYYTHPECPKEGMRLDRTLEDLKDRYYAVSRVLTQSRAQQDTRDLDDLPLQATNKLADDLALLRFDKTKEQERKRYLEALFRRTKDEIEEEEMLIAEARRIEANERRLVHEREMLIQSHVLFDEVPAGDVGPAVKVQFSSGSDLPLQSGVATPLGEHGRVRKGGPDGSDTGSIKSIKRHKSSHNVAGRHRAGSQKADAHHGAPKLSASGVDASGRHRTPSSPGLGSAPRVKDERGSMPPEFGKLTFATEEHLVDPAISYVTIGEGETVAVAQRDTKLGPGVFLRSDKLHPIPKNKLEAVKDFMHDLGLSSPNTIWPRPVMATPAVCDRFDSLQSTIIPLLDCKKTVDKLETEVQVLRSRRRLLVNDIGEAKAQAIVSKLPPLTPAKIAEASRSLSPAVSETPLAGRHNRKGSSASSRKKHRD